MDNPFDGFTTEEMKQELARREIVMEQSLTQDTKVIVKKVKVENNDTRRGPKFFTKSPFMEDPLVKTSRLLLKPRFFTKSPFRDE